MFVQIEKIDVLYIFNYEYPFIEGAIARLRCSIMSIIRQDVRICISNNSSLCILDKIIDLVPDLKYVHAPYFGPFSKALFINFGVKQLISGEYFYLSDVDLIYSNDHFQKIYEKCKLISTNGEKVRFITYNYNLAPIYKNSIYMILDRIPFINNLFNSESLVFPHLYTHDYVVLDKFKRLGGGFAHGPGLIHTETFFKIRGYDEDLIGHGPEDDLFNNRIGKVNRLIYDNLPDTATFHLWHPMFQRIQVEENLKIWAEKKKMLDNLIFPTINDVCANLHKREWGEL